MRVTNKNPKEPRKPLTRNQKIAGIVIIVLGGLFLLNEIWWKMEQDADIKRQRDKYCTELMKIDVNLYMADKRCNP